MDPDFIVRYPKLNDSKTTIVVSKVVSKKAVDRNRIKRIVKEALRKLDYQQGVVIIVRNNIASLKMQEVKEKLEKLLKI